MEGLILVAPLLGDQMTEVLACFSMPVVVVDPRQLSDWGYPTIVADNYRAARSSTEILLRIGHRRVGFVGGDPSLDSAQQRKRGHLESVSLSSADTDFPTTLLGVGEGTVNVFTRTDEVAVHELEGMISGRPHTPELKAGQLNGTAASAIATAWAPQLKRNAGG